VAECVQSVLAQSWRNYEIIIVNDGSTDATAGVLSGLADTHTDKIQLAQQPNQGPGAARQKGLEMAKGEYVQFLDSDDLIRPEKFELCVSAFESESRPDIVYGVTHYYHQDRPDDYIVWKQTSQPISTILPGFFSNRAWATSTPLYRHSLLVKAGKILPLSCEEDVEFDCRIGIQKPVIEFINRHLTDFRHHEGERFSVNHSNRERQLTDQVQARSHIFATMRACGLPDDSNEMKQFSKGMFLLARQCAAQGLAESAIAALDTARKAATGLDNKDKLAMQAYRLAGHGRGARLFNRVYDWLYRVKNG